MHVVNPVSDRLLKTRSEPLESVETSFEESVFMVKTLDDPLMFEEWWTERLKNASSIAIADELEAIGTPLAMVRCGQVLGFRPEVIERGTRCSRIGLLSDDSAVRLFALLRLAVFETQAGYVAQEGDLYGSPTVIPTLDAILENAELMEHQSLLLLEVKMRSHALRAEARMLESNHELAKRDVAIALLMADALGLNVAKQRMRLIQYSIFFDSGFVLHARDQFKRLAEDPQTDQEWARLARHMVGLSHLVVGDDDAAIQWFSEHTDYDLVFPELYGFALAVAGLGGTERNYSNYSLYFTSETTVLFRCYQLLLENNTRPSEASLRRIHELCNAARTASKWIVAEFHWLKSYASYRLGEYGIAELSFPNLSDVQKEQTALRCMILALSLELSVSFQGRDVLTPDETAKALHDLLVSLPFSVHRCLARRISIFLPLAGAFLAYSPHATPEIVEYCSGAVLQVAGKISVHNGRKLQPIHAGFVALEDFGFECDYHPNQLQIVQEREAKLYSVGHRLHWHRAVSSALLIYAYYRIHWLVSGAFARTEISIWERNARSLLSSHGLISRPRGFEIEKRHRLEQLLNALVNKEITPEEVRRRI